MALDTIFALASGRGKAGIAVVRLSGPAARTAAERICGTLPAARHAQVRTLRGEDDVIDQALTLWFPGPGTFTGEDIVEFHVHGSSAVVSALLQALSGQQGLRMAEPGEFTRRALENGKLDLTQVEGLADLIDAETEAQRRQALRVLSGSIGDRVRNWRDWLIRTAALLEASIDFVDEDVPVDVWPEVDALLRQLHADLQKEAQGFAAAERIRDGFEVAIVGAPNAGKSTLLNMLAQREAAITSSMAGTTRDVIEVRMDIRGLPVTLLDTAGLRATDDSIESIGIERAIKRAGAADLRIFLVDGNPDFALLQPGSDDLVVQAKSDIARAVAGRPGVSGRTGEGLKELLDAVFDKLSRRAATAGVLVRERHRRAILRTIEAVESALSGVEADLREFEVVAEDVRRAIRALDALTGKVDVEDVLDQIFASFCIGK